MEEIPELKELSPSDLWSKLTINQENIDFEIKCEAAFQYNGKYIFYEVKGAGENTNDILSAITAAQLLKEIPKYKNSYYYYIGISRKKTNDAFFDKKRTKITPYVKWAENRGFLKFYSIVDIEKFIEELKNLIQTKS